VGGRRTERTQPSSNPTVLARYQERYFDFGPPLAVEKLALEGHVLDHETKRLVNQSRPVAEEAQARQTSQVGGSAGRTLVS